jgi:hypothetical protein
MDQLNPGKSKVKIAIQAVLYLVLITMVAFDICKKPNGIDSHLKSSLSLPICPNPRDPHISLKYLAVNNLGSDFDILKAMKPVACGKRSKHPYSYCVFNVTVAVNTVAFIN